MSQRSFENVDYGQLFEQAPAGYVVATVTGTVLAANATMCSWIGVPPGGLDGTRVLDLFPVGDRLMYRTHATPQLDQDGWLSELSLQLLAQDGQRRPVLLSVNRIREGAQTLDTMVFFAAPERRRYERELANAHRHLEDIEADRSRLLKDARDRALHDPLTGLPNRLKLEETLIVALAEAAERGSGVGALFCDVNDFKQVNDAFGHAVGDEVLQHIAQRLVGAVRGTDTVCRISGDEFVIVMPLLDNSKELEEVALRVRDSVADQVTIAGADLRLGISVGWAETHLTGETMAADYRELAKALLIAADRDMYRVKAGKRGEQGTGSTVGGSTPTSQKTPSEDASGLAD